MKKLINQFMDWKKSIEYVPMYELNAVLDDSEFVKEIKVAVEGIQNQIEDIHLNYYLKNNKFNFESFNLGDHFHGEKFSAESEPLIGTSPYHRSILIQSIIRKERQLDNASISCIVQECPKSLIDIIKKNFHSGLFLISLSNPTLRCWDTKTLPVSYKYKKGIKLYLDPISRFEKVDISSRPGRPASLKNFHFRGANEYWFGSCAYTSIPKDLILAFKNAEIIEELENDILYVKLFDNGQYWEDFAQQRLALFRSHLNIDELEKQYLGLINSKK